MFTHEARGSFFADLHFQPSISTQVTSRDGVSFLALDVLQAPVIKLIIQFTIDSIAVLLSAPGSYGSFTLLERVSKFSHVDFSDVSPGTYLLDVRILRGAICNYEGNVLVFTGREISQYLSIIAPPKLRTS